MDNNYNGNYAQNGYNQNNVYGNGYNNGHNAGYNNYNYNQSNNNRNTTGNYMGDEYKPIRAIGYVGYMWLFAIPIVGLICLIVFACSNKNINRRNFARSYFLNFLLSLLLGALIAVPLFMGLGVSIFNDAQNIAEESASQIDTLMISTFNSRYEIYFGTGRNKFEVLKLMNAINSNNTDSSAVKEISLIGDRTSTDQVREDSNAQTYTVSGSYDKDGYIDKISITI